MTDSPLLTFFDTNATVGRSRAPVMPDPDVSVERLLADHARHHITGAAVAHAVAMEASPRMGHQLLDEEIAAHGHLRPAWHLMPHVDNRIERGATDPGELIERRVALGRITMGDFCAGRGDEAGFGPVLDACNAVALPVFLDFTLEGGHDAFRSSDFAFVARYPRIPFVIEGFGGYPLHRLMWLLHAHANVHVSTVGFSVYRGIELICDTVGPERVIFGSCWPRTPIGMAQGLVLFAEVPESARRLMASENFCTLLAGIGRVS